MRSFREGCGVVADETNRSDANMENSDMESARTIEDQAARWLVKRDAGEWTERDQAALDRWLDSSTANVVAFVRLETAWQRTHRLKSLGAGVPPGMVPS